MLRSLIYLVLIASVLSFSLPVYARPGAGVGGGGGAMPGMGRGGPGHGGGFEGMIPERALKELDLSDEQKKKLKEIRKSGKEDLENEREELMELRDELRKKMESASASEDEIRKSFDKLQSKDTSIRKQAFDRMLKIRSVLTVEQRKQLSELIKKRHKRGGPGGRDEGFGRPPGGRPPEMDEE